MTERELQTKVIHALRHVYHVKIIVASTSGHPDIIACVNGRLVALELKSDKGKLSPLQREKLKQIRKSGGYAALVSPKNYKNIVEKLLVFS